jgi:methyl-accepting chemotaxis protein
MGQIASAADGMSAQAEQVLRGAADQARAMRAMTSDAQNTAKQIKLITKANLEHSTSASALLATVSEIRQITDRNSVGVKQTRGGTDDLRRRAQALAALVEQPATPSRKTNGRAPRSGR